MKRALGRTIVAVEEEEEDEGAADAFDHRTSRKAKNQRFTTKRAIWLFSPGPFCAVFLFSYPHMID